MPITLTKNNFNKEVLQDPGPVLVDFWASWCGPCSALAPTIDEIAQEQTGCKVGKVNVDEEPELARRFGVMNIPTVVFLREGREFDRKVGAFPAEVYVEALDKAL